jgi:hypothetical protein
MSDKPAYTAAYTGDGIEAYEPMGVGGGAQEPPVLSDATLRSLRDAVHQASKAPWFASPIPYIRRTEAAARAALEAEVQRLEAENQRLAALLADAENIVRDPYAVQAGSGGLNDMAFPPEFPPRALRGGDGRPR